MIDDDVKTELQKLDTRLANVEQFLPTVMTKEDLGHARRELEAVLATLATKDDLKNFATKDELLALREELKAFPTRQEMREEAEQTRRHFDVIAESLRDEIRLALEGNMSVTSRVETLERQHGRLERRVTVLEAGGARRKK